jgi:hypothetical protein
MFVVREMNEHENMVGSWIWMHGPEKTPITMTNKASNFFLKKNTHTQKTTTTKSRWLQQRTRSRSHAYYSSLHENKCREGELSIFGSLDTSAFSTQVVSSSFVCSVQTANRSVQTA